MPYFKCKIMAMLMEDGLPVAYRETDNFLTEGGEALIANRLSTQSQAAFSHMAIGTGTGQDRTDNALDVQLTRVALDSLNPGTAGDDNDVIMVCTFPTGTSGAISEGGVFNDSTAGTMLNYFNFVPPIQKATGQTLVLTVTMTCGYS